tara:strand:- start:932 stop:1810 length:879 start_codon:yes stop_codon:yes gene_type:complete
MKYFLTLALFACSLVGYTQVSASFNPDYNGDGYVGVDDILGVLSHYDTPWEADAAENMVVDSLETIITEVSSVNDSLQSELEYAQLYGCIPLEYPLYASWWVGEAAISWQQNLIEAHAQINSLIPGYMTYCQLASWQAPAFLDCFTNPETGEQTCFWPEVLYEASHVLNDLNYYLDIQEEFGYEVPSSNCLIQLKSSSATACGGWNTTNQASGIGGSAAMQLPSGSGALLVRASGINRTYSIHIPSSMEHVFWQVSGIDCHWNIYYNPSNTTIGAGPSGSNLSVNFIEDTSL